MRGDGRTATFNVYGADKDGSSVPPIVDNQLWTLQRVWVLAKHRAGHFNLSKAL